MAVNWNVNVSLIILYVARINGRLMDRLMIIIRFILFSTLIAINWNVNWRLIYFYGVASKIKERMWYEGGGIPYPIKTKA